MKHTRHSLRRVLSLIAAGLFLVPVWSESFDWDAAVAIESSVSVGDLADAAEVAPEDLGGDALLDREDLRAAGEAAYEVQSVFRSTVTGQVRAAWTSPGVALELALSGLVLQSPSGYGGDGFVFAPGPSGVRVLRSPSSWSGGRLMVWLGREMLVDPSGLVVRQLADGAGFALRYPQLYVSLGAGTTGLVDKHVFDSRMLERDRSVFADESTPFAPARLIALARVEYGEVLGNDFGVFAAYYDARAPGPQDDAWYAGLVVDGGGRRTGNPPDSAHPAGTRWRGRGSLARLVRRHALDRPARATPDRWRALRVVRRSFALPIRSDLDVCGRTRRRGSLRRPHPCLARSRCRSVGRSSIHAIGSGRRLPHSQPRRDRRRMARCGDDRENRISPARRSGDQR